ncbi:hypothetical protein SAMN04487895_103227 [Paenibacillus sophorae]|uniref:Uncharacterized protein n=1 Tax=Paenibacillus sophorae TaxID=1333845 RepID=A0A1H8K1C7_9BACL|nr:hypothetical protein [Paenibacillus sophorae]QWU13554.1 hypothetical protein KP014_16305 [Paenibacillus sophorae]SEN86477.1 hypothetical protein SAMN04487895_103227 [Paenibacillus sophorae]
MLFKKTKKNDAFVTADILVKVARGMLPFYRAIAGNRSYANAWSRAVVGADLRLMASLLKLVAPLAARQGYGTNAIGYFITYTFPLPIASYTNGTTIPPGLVQFTFSTKIHRRIARAVLPLYRELAFNRNFAAALARAIRRGDRKAVACMVRGLVCTRSLRSVKIEESGIALLFKYSGSPYPYRNLLFRELD